MMRCPPLMPSELRILPPRSAIMGANPHRSPDFISLKQVSVLDQICSIFRSRNLITWQLFYSHRHFGARAYRVIGGLTRCVTGAHV
jgi:hypothetical protein